MSEVCQSLVYLVFGLLMLTTDTKTRTNKQDYYTQCGTLINKTKGIIQTPGFPKRFPVPIKCRWVIDASAHPDKNIVVYLTQLYVTTGLKFTDYVYYENDSGMKYSENVGHIVTPENVTSSPWIRSFAPYLMIEFELHRLEGNHLRFLDDKHNVYFMYGFNITFELIERHNSVRESCNARICSLLGQCYASADFSQYECSCFQGFSGPNCAQGPLCEGHTCKNGGTCVHSSAVSFGCKCTKGFAGSKCEFPLKLACDGKDCNETQCFYDGISQPSCECDDPQIVPADRARYEGTIYFKNSTFKSGPKFSDNKNKSFETFLEKMVIKHLKSYNVSSADHFKLLKYKSPLPDTMSKKYFTEAAYKLLSFGEGERKGEKSNPSLGYSTPSGADVTFHFFGAKKDDDEIRLAFRRLIERESSTLAASNVTLQRDATLSIENVVVSKKSIRVGQEFSISCVAHGSIYMTFTWLKDGAFINESVITRSVSMHLIYLTRGRYQYTLKIDKANSLDEGIYTCHVSDWHVQQCKGVHVDVAGPPEIRLTPMSATVEKGASLDLVCIPLNNRPKQEKFGYSWIKNKQLLKMTPEREVWEDLYLSHYNGVVNTGSVLEITNIQKSATYTCQAQGIGASSELSVHIEVVNKSVVPLCLAEGKYGVAWQATAPGLETIADCPFHSGGHARRECRLTDFNTTRWDIPNFTGCLSADIEMIYNNFTRLTLGYEVTNGSITMSNLFVEVSKRMTFLPGECERIVDILTEVLKYLNGSLLFNDLQNSAGPFFNVIDLLLSHEHCFITEKKIVQLQNLVKLKGIVWGSLFLSPPSVFLDLNSLVIEVTKLKNKETHHLSFPPKNKPHPSWLSDKIAVRVNTSKFKAPLGENFTVVVAIYRNLTQFLKQRYLAKFDDGTDLEYEINSRLVTVELGRQRYRINPVDGSFLIEVELQHLSKNDNPGLWRWRCGVAEFASFRGTWDLNSCTDQLISENTTKCRCKKTGTYAVLLISKSRSTLSNSNENQHFIVVIGCGCCLVQSLLTLCLLLPYWCRRKTCLVFLKMQCCLATACAMSVFIYSIQHSVSKAVFPLITTVLEIFLLVGLSSHLSKLLVVYTEIIQLPTNKHMKETVVCIITGVPVLAVLCNFLGYHSTGWNLRSWWIIKGSMIFNVFITSAVILVILFVFLYVSVVRKLYVMSERCSDKNKAVFRRIGLLKRGGIIFLTMILMESASIFYINVLDISSQYFFSSSSALLGFVILFCYILKSECSFQDKLIKSLKASPADDDFSSESIISPLRFFTKQDGDAESEGAPPPRSNAVSVRNREFRNGTKSSRDRPEHLMLSDSLSKRKDEGATSTLETFVGSTDGSIENRMQEQLPLTPTKYKPLTSFRMQEPDFGEYVEQDQPPLSEEESWKYVKSNGILPKPDTAQCYIRDTQVAPQEIITTRVCVELGVITAHQKNELTGQDVATPAIVLCSVDVEPCQSRMVEMTEVVGDSICCNGVSNTGSFVLGVTGQESDNMVCSNPELKETSPEESKAEDCSNSEKTDSSSIPDYEGERKQPEGEAKKNSEKKTEDNMEGMLDRISHDLDYLLNRKSVPVLRKTSKPPSNSIRGKICEEDEENVSSEFHSKY